MIIEKVWELKDKNACNSIYKNVLFPSIGLAIQETKLTDEDFRLMAEITFNDDGVIIYT